jgi:HlyD family secretion protein
MRKLPLMAIALLFLAQCGKKGKEVRPERKDITETVFASGTLEPEYVYNLTAQTEGIITSLSFDAGDTIREGQLLGVIDNRSNSISAASSERLARIAEINASPSGPVLKQAKQNLALLRQKLSQDSVQWQRFEKLFESKSVSKLELENARLAYETTKTNYLNAEENYRFQEQQAEQQLVMQRSQRDISSVAGGYNEIRAVKAGKVYKRVKEAGDYVRRGELIAVIGDVSKMYARLSIDENNISKVKLNQEVAVELNTERGRNYKAVIDEVLPAFDEATQSFICKARFIESPGFRVSGTQLQANIIIARRKNSLVIPKTYLSYSGSVTVKGEGPVAVKTGFISGEWVEILSGIDENAVLTAQ